MLQNQEVHKLMSDQNGTEQAQPTTAAAWKKAAVHPIRLPSGVYVEIKVPDLPALIEAGEIPQNLLDAALSMASGQARQTPTKELIIKQREFTDKLVQIAVVRPKLSEEDLPGVPYEDKEMIVEIATRQRDLDAEGHHIGGLHKSEAFRKFRGLSGLDPTLEGV